MQQELLNIGGEALEHLGGQIVEDVRSSRPIDRETARDRLTARAQHRHQPDGPALRELVQRFQVWERRVRLQLPPDNLLSLLLRQLDLRPAEMPHLFVGQQPADVARRLPAAEDQANDTARQLRESERQQLMEGRFRRERPASCRTR